MTAKQKFMLFKVMDVVGFIVGMMGFAALLFGAMCVPVSERSIPDMIVALVMACGPMIADSATLELRRRVYVEYDKESN